MKKFFERLFTPLNTKILIICPFATLASTQNFYQMTSYTISVIIGLFLITVIDLCMERKYSKNNK